MKRITNFLASALIVMMIAATMFSLVAGTLDRLGYTDHAIAVGLTAAAVAVVLVLGVVVRLRRHDLHKL